MAFNVNIDLEAGRVSGEKLADDLEEAILECNKAAARGEELLPDAIYDSYKAMLRGLRPDSVALNTIWSEDDPTVAPDAQLDKYLSKFPMFSICTLKDLGEKRKDEFAALLPVGDVEYIASAKINGHGIRIAGVDGKILRATTRGRSTNGRDITNLIHRAFGDKIDGLAGCGVFDIRAEIACPFSNVAKVLEMNPKLVNSAFTVVASLIKPSASDAELSMLRLVCYNIEMDNPPNGGFTKLSEKFEFLESIGLTVPLHFEGTTTRSTLREDLEEAVEYMTELSEDYDLFMDGCVFGVDNIELFYSMGTDKTSCLGNLALKTGRWEQDMYQSEVEGIEWNRGKAKFTPVAVVAPTVTFGNRTVTHVPLYIPCNILIMEAYIGRTIHFRFGGEAGVVPCLPNGMLLSDKAVKTRQIELLADYFED